jgi:2-polyprenyl-6-methoxyphenol hydroxylase-like FAD-dependent oxidoreductase
VNALVIGAGIGGLAAAIALRRQGIDAHVFERAPKLTEVGAGISLWANAVRALDVLGLGEMVRAASQPYEVAGLRAADGEVLVTLPADELERQFGVITIIMHRADLLALLQSATPAAGLSLGKTLTAFSQDANGVTATFHDGSNARGDVLIGADGLHSTVRAAVLGDMPPRYAGCTAWRAVVSFARETVRASESWGRGRIFGQVPMSGGRVYWYATHNRPAGLKSNGAKAELLHLFGGWHRPVRALIETTDDSAILRNDIYDRAPVSRWGSGRVTLLGDAAHPMTPYLGQGGCQALEDAVVLARCLGESGVLPQALRDYESVRRPRANKFVKRSWQAGRLAQLENPVAVALRNALMRRSPRRLHAKQLAELIGTVEIRRDHSS